MAGEPTHEGKPNAYAPNATMTITFEKPVPPEISERRVAINTRFETQIVLIGVHFATKCRGLPGQRSDFPDIIGFVTEDVWHNGRFTEKLRWTAPANA